MRRLAAMLLIVAACAGSQTLTGELVLAEGYEGTSPCRGTGGYSDVRAGMDVTVYDGTGAVVGSGATEPGRAVVAGCRLLFTVEGIDGGADFYRIEVGRRGDFTYSNAELDALGWDVAYTLGD